ncbi:hypothetical protein P7C70_g9143, partial [Phenoliferia sp. Uapishka_3]
MARPNLLKKATSTTPNQQPSSSATRASSANQAPRQLSQTDETSKVLPSRQSANLSFKDGEVARNSEEERASRRRGREHSEEEQDGDMPAQKKRGSKPKSKGKPPVIIEDDEEDEENADMELPAPGQQQLFNGSEKGGTDDEEFVAGADDDEEEEEVDDPPSTQQSKGKGKARDAPVRDAGTSSASHFTSHKRGQRIEGVSSGHILEQCSFLTIPFSLSQQNFSSSERQQVRLSNTKERKALGDRTNHPHSTPTPNPKESSTPNNSNDSDGEEEWERALIGSKGRLKVSGMSPEQAWHISASRQNMFYRILTRNAWPIPGPEEDEVLGVSWQVGWQALVEHAESLNLTLSRSTCPSLRKSYLTLLRQRIQTFRHEVAKAAAHIVPQYFPQLESKFPERNREWAIHL